ncbi:hypothetical protein BT96DRAFT_869678, partial [Gymnopus androsaceus JB14]
MAANHMELSLSRRLRLTISRPMARNPANQFDIFNTHRTSGYEDTLLDMGSKPDQNAMDDDEPDDIADEPPVPSSTQKGKKSISEQDEPSEGPADEDEQEEEELLVPAKKAKLDKGKEKARRGGQDKQNRTHVEGVRHSQRKRIRPLEWWRNEKYVYERPAQGGILVPHVKEILRIPEEPKKSLQKHRTKRKRGRSETVDPAPPKNPEEDWDKDTSPIGIVLEWKTKKPIDKRITCLAKNVKPQPGVDNGWFFQKIFGDDSFTAAGQLIIPVGGTK